MNMNLVHPNYHCEDYDPAKCVRTKDRWRQFLFIKNGAKIHDIYVNGDDLIMVFDLKETKELHDKYKRYELK